MCHLPAAPPAQGAGAVHHAAVPAVQEPGAHDVPLLGSF